MNEFEMEDLNVIDNDGTLSTEVENEPIYEEQVEPCEGNTNSNIKAYAIGGAVGAAGGVACGFFLVPRLVKFYKRKRAERRQKKLEKLQAENELDHVEKS